MTQTIKAIETEYAGCRFRSRLEARWAVFFDHLAIRWEYEPEGLEIDGVRYLPDFRLPDMDGLYVEVKGRMDEKGMRKILTLAHRRQGVLVLGAIPLPDLPGPHHPLYVRASGRVVEAWRVNFSPAGPDREWSVLPFGWPRPVNRDLDGDVTAEVDAFNAAEQMEGLVLTVPELGEAFTAARSARFEVFG